jgi:hypothetical protein
VNGCHLKWEDDAEDQLTRLWVNNKFHRNAITAAQHRIDRQLLADPFAKSRYVSEDLFRIDLPPLAVFFTINTAVRLVTVTDVYLLFDRLPP